MALHQRNSIGSETGESYVGLKVKPSITGLWNQGNTQKYIVENSDATAEHVQFHQRQKKEHGLFTYCILLHKRDKNQQASKRHQHRPDEQRRFRQNVKQIIVGQNNLFR